MIILFFPVNKVEYVKAEEETITHQQLVWLYTLENCESRGREDIKILDSNKKYSYGVLQFQMDTFLREGKKYGLIEANLTSKEVLETKMIYDVDLQESIANRILLDGGESHWHNCWHTKLKTKYPR